ncbi:MAG: FISUMP domain-containing protein [Fibrobacteraceae bacterium]|jgi:uncharacterized protein (TIGR02145 family)|nr:FISUMP domain-containing protein [Fibrobacteraceae bacterium]
MNIEEFTDTRDGRTYSIVMIGDALWMAENLNYACPGSFSYENSSQNRDQYGLLYTYEAALKALPKGWRLPTKKDWEELFKNAGGDDAGLLLKGETLGFKALLSGYRNSDGIFKDVSDKAYFWSAEHFGSLAEYVGLLKISDSPLRLFESVHAACSVRAVFDA